MKSHKYPFPTIELQQFNAWKKNKAFGFYMDFPVISLDQL